MKLVIVVVAFLAIAVVTVAEKYTSKYDNIDVDEIFKSDRLFNNYYKCLNDEGKCTPDARELKELLPDALQTECKKCTDKQLKNTDKVVHFLIKNKPEQWKVLQQKYDPNNVYFTKIQREAVTRGIQVDQL